MKLQTKRDFNKLAQEFMNNKFDLTTVSNLIVLVRGYNKEISKYEAELLLEIPLNVLSNDVELIDESEWADKNAGYFEGNITWTDDDFKNFWKSKFSSGKYGLKDIIELCKVVSEDFEKYRNSCEFLLRNVEVTLRDDVKIKKSSNFKDSGNVFSSHILKAIN